MLRRFVYALVLATALPVVASAESFTAYGPHLGFTSGPDQFIVGGHLQWGDVAPRLDFVPSADLGLGDDRTVISLNGDFRYRIEARSSWQPYIGGGVGIHFISYDGPAGDDNAAGGHFLLGADVATKSGSRFFADLKIGLADAPDLKVSAGWSFRP
jgi:hypothetical protein